MEKYQALPPSAHSSALQLSPAIKPASDRLLRGQVYRGRSGEERKKKIQAQHANQVFPLPALSSKDSKVQHRGRRVGPPP